MAFSRLPRDDTGSLSVAAATTTELSTASSTSPPSGSYFGLLKWPLLIGGTIAVGTLAAKYFNQRFLVTIPEGFYAVIFDPKRCIVHAILGAEGDLVPLGDQTKYPARPTPTSSPTQRTDGKRSPASWASTSIPAPSSATSPLNHAGRNSGSAQGRSCRPLYKKPDNSWVVMKGFNLGLVVGDDDQTTLLLPQDLFDVDRCVPITLTVDDARTADGVRVAVTVQFSFALACMNDLERYLAIHGKTKPHDRIGIETAVTVREQALQIESAECMFSAQRRSRNFDEGLVSALKVELLTQCAVRAHNIKVLGAREGGQ